MTSLKQKLAEVNKIDCIVSSAGLGELLGHKADPSACQLMMEKGIDISGHRVCQLNNEMIRKTDLFLTMELSQKIGIIENIHSTRGKVFRLGEWGRFDVVNPYQKELAIFEKSLTSIEQGISQWIEKLLFKK